MHNGGNHPDEKRDHELLGLDNNPSKRRRVEETLDQQEGKEMLLHMEAAKSAAERHQQQPQPPPPPPKQQIGIVQASGKQAQRCQVCVRAKKGGCGTKKAVYRCLRRPGGPRAASLCVMGEGKEDGVTHKKSRKEDSGSWHSLNTRVAVKYNGSWHDGVVRRVHKGKLKPYGIKLDADKDNNQLLWTVKNCVLRSNAHLSVDFLPGESDAHKEDENLSQAEESPKRLSHLNPGPILGIPTEVMQQIHSPGLQKFVQPVVRDAATGGVKLCRKCNQPALPGNYGFCALHRTPRSRGSGKQEGVFAGLFTPGMSAILQRALQAQAMHPSILSGAASANGSPFAVPSMASMGALAPPFLPPHVPFFPPQTAEATPIASAASATPPQNIAGMMMMPGIRGGQEMPIVYGAPVGEFLPGATIVEAEAEAVASAADDPEMREQKIIEIPQTAVQSGIPDGSEEKAPYDLYASLPLFGNGSKHGNAVFKSM